MKLVKVALVLSLSAVAAWTQVNAGEQKPEASLPFTMTTVATFELPWRLAFLPDGRMLITEKVGRFGWCHRMERRFRWPIRRRFIGRARMGCWASSSHRITLQTIAFI